MKIKKVNELNEELTNVEFKDMILSRILYLSNTDYVNDAHEMQCKLEEINVLIKQNFPQLKEL